MSVITKLFAWTTRVILIAILAAVFGFLILFAYFLVGRSWGMPVILTPGNPAVTAAQPNWLDRNSRLAELDEQIADTRKAHLQARETEAVARLTYRSIPASLARQRSLVAGEIRSNRHTTEDLTTDQSAAEATLVEIKRNADPEKWFKSGLITRSRLVAEVRARGDLSNQIISSRARVADYKTRLADLREQANSLDSAILFKPGSNQSAISHDDLAQVSAYRQAELDLQVAKGEVGVLSLRLARVQKMRNEVVASLQHLAASPLLAATRGPVVVVFVPYENSSSFEKSLSLYGCRFWLIWCSRIGSTGKHDDGEVTMAHPLYGKKLRGNYYTLKEGQEIIPLAARNTLVFSAPPFFL